MVDGALVMCLQEDFKNAFPLTTAAVHMDIFSLPFLILLCFAFPALFSTLTVVETGSRRNIAFKKRVLEVPFLNAYVF